MNFLFELHNTFPEIDLAIVIAIWFFTGSIKKIVRNRVNQLVYDIICFLSPVIFGILWGIATKQGITQGIIIGGFAGFTYQIVKPIIKKLRGD